MLNTFKNIKKITTLCITGLIVTTNISPVLADTYPTENNTPSFEIVENTFINNEESIFIITEIIDDETTNIGITPFAQYYTGTKKYDVSPRHPGQNITSSYTITLNYNYLAQDSYAEFTQIMINRNSGSGLTPQGSRNGNKATAQFFSSPENISVSKFVFTVNTNGAISVTESIN